MMIDSIDIFCDVIDNYGDVGVTYRLAREFSKIYPEAKIRLILNSINEFELMKNNSASFKNIEVLSFQDIEGLENIKTANLIIEAFGCDLPEKYLERAYFDSDLLINLEYFSAETWIDDFHLVESPLAKGKLKKIFFMPGLSEKSGGLVVDKEFLETIAKVQKNKKFYLDKYNLAENQVIATVFSYEKNFEKFLEGLAKLKKKITLLIMSEKTQKNFTKYFENKEKYDKITFVKCPFYKYDEYQEILALSDFNLVRGEDSFARALILGKPFLWHIYPQEENIHLKKLNDFLDRYSSDEKLKQTFISYNTCQNEDYTYFFENMKQIAEHNKNYSTYIIENLDLVKKIKNYIENFRRK